jgi:hypothetical protein
MKNIKSIFLFLFMAHYVIPTYTQISHGRNDIVITTKPACYMQSNGSIDIVFNNNQPNDRYTINWMEVMEDGSRSQILDWPKNNLVYGANTEDLIDRLTGHYTVYISKYNTNSQEVCEFAIFNVFLEEQEKIELDEPEITPICPNLGKIKFEYSFYGKQNEYNYLWSNGIQTFNNLEITEAGTHTLKILDNFGCESNFDFLVPKNEIFVVENVVNTCLENTINLNISPTTQDIKWEFNNIPVETLKGQTIIQYLIPGEYKYIINSNINTCKIENTIQIIEKKTIELDQNKIRKIHPSCLGNDGEIEINPILISGGTPPYNFAWSNSKTDSKINLLNEGIYSVTISDSEGCSKNYSFDLQSTSLINSIRQNITVKHSQCSLKNGEITIHHGESVTFTWAYPISKTETGYSTNLSNLSPGIYWVKVQKNEDCYIWLDVEIKEGNLDQFQFEYYLDKYPALCGNDGKAEFILPESWKRTDTNVKWSTGSTEYSIANLIPGLYNIEINYGTCKYSASVDINNNIFQTINPTCNETNGRIYSLYNFPPNINFNWSNGSTARSLNNLSEGNYSVTISAPSCSRVFSFQLIKSLEGNIAQIIDIECQSTDLFLLPQINPEYNPEELVYNWSNGATTMKISAEVNKTYKLTITDNTNCREILKIQTNNLLTNLEVYDQIVCNDELLIGGISYNIKHPAQLGENQPYNIYTNFKQNQTLEPGSYNLLIQYNNCSETYPFTVKEKQPSLLLKSKVNPTSPCVSDGFIEVESLPKNSRIEWASHEQSTTSLNNLPEGTYTATAYFADCSISKTFEICACDDCTSDDGNGNIIPYPSCGNSGLDYSYNITPTSSNVSEDGAINLNIETQEKIVFDWYKVINKNEIHISNSKDLIQISPGIYKLYITNGCQTSMQEFLVPINETCVSTSIEYELLNTPCINGYQYLRITECEQYVYIVADNKYIGQFHAGDQIGIPITGPNTTILIYESNLKCRVATIINTISVGHLNAYLNLEEVKPCQSFELEVYSTTPEYTVELLNSETQSYTIFKNLTGSKVTIPYNTSGKFNITITSACGIKKEIIQELPCSCRFPEIIQEAPCFDPCDIFDLLGTCSKLEINEDKLSQLNENFKITFTRGNQMETTNIINSEISGISSFKPKNAGEVIVLFEGSKGCNLSKSFFFGGVNNFYCIDSKSNQLNYNHYIEEYIPQLGSNAITGTWQFSDSGCLAFIDASLPLQSQPNYREFPIKYTPDDFSNPCGGGTLTLKYPCNGNETKPSSEIYPTNINLPTYSTANCEEVQPCIMYDLNGANYKVEVCKSSCPDFFSYTFKNPNLISIFIGSYITASCTVVIRDKSNIVNSHPIQIIPGNNIFDLDIRIPLGNYTIEIISNSGCPILSKDLNLCPTNFQVYPTEVFKSNECMFILDKNYNGEATVIFDPVFPGYTSKSYNIHFNNGQYIFIPADILDFHDVYKISINIKESICQTYSGMFEWYDVALHDPNDCNNLIESITSNNNELIVFTNVTNENLISGSVMSSKNNSNYKLDSISYPLKSKNILFTDYQNTCIIDGSDTAYQIRAINREKREIFKLYFPNSFYLNSYYENNQIKLVNYNLHNGNIELKIVNETGQIISERILNLNNIPFDHLTSKLYIKNDSNYIITKSVNDTIKVINNQNQQIILDNINSIKDVFFINDTILLLASLDTSLNNSNADPVITLKRNSQIIMLDSNINIIKSIAYANGHNINIEKATLYNNKIYALLTDYYPTFVNDTLILDSCKYIDEIYPTLCVNSNPPQIFYDTINCIMEIDSNAIISVELKVNGLYEPYPSSVNNIIDLVPFANDTIKITRIYENCINEYIDTFVINCNYQNCYDELLLSYNSPDSFLYVSFNQTDTLDLMLTIDFRYDPNDTIIYSTSLNFTTLPGSNIIPINVETICPANYGYMIFWTFTLSCPDCSPQCFDLSATYYWGPALTNNNTESRSSNKYNLFPNPFSNGISFFTNSNKSGTINLVFHNILGTEVYNENHEIQKGENTIFIKESVSWSPGIYFCELIDSENKKVITLLKIE